MHRFSIVACAAAICCLAGSAGCCCCQRGFSVSGDWSLQMDRLPNDCAHGGCGHGHLGEGPEASLPVSAAPLTSPPFHPLPTGPVGNVTVPHPAPAPPGVASLPAVSNPPPKQLSVLKPEPAPVAGSSSWMFVERQGPSAAPSNLPQRRQLAAEGWTTVRR